MELRGNQSNGEGDGAHGEEFAGLVVDLDGSDGQALFWRTVGVVGELADGLKTFVGLVGQLASGDFPAAAVKHEDDGIGVEALVAQP